MELDAVGFGALNYDYFYFVDAIARGDDQVTIKHTHAAPGGSSANTIYALAKLGIRTGYYGALGDDDEGNKILEQMEEMGVDKSKIKVNSENNTSKVLVFVDPMGERAMYTLPGASSTITLDEEDITYLCSSKYTIISSLPGKSQIDSLQNVVTQIHEDTKIVFMPGGFYSNLGFEKLKDILTKCYLLVLNRRELEEITGKKHKNSKNAANWLLDNGCNIVTVTLGERGSYISSNKLDHQVPSIELPKNKIVDSTGAGDAYTAGLVYGLLKKKSISELAFLGNIAARFCVQGYGARDTLPDRNNLENEFEKYYRLIKGD